MMLHHCRRLMPITHAGWLIIKLLLLLPLELLQLWRWHAVRRAGKQQTQAYLRIAV